MISWFGPPQPAILGNQVGETLNGVAWFLLALAALGQALAVWPLPTPPLPLTPPTLEDGMHLIVGRQANHADPRRWAWDGISIRKIADEAEFERLYLGPYAVFKLHPSFNTLAAPYWLSDEDIARYATPDKGLAA